MPAMPSRGSNRRYSTRKFLSSFNGIEKRHVRAFSSEACPGRDPGWIPVRVKKTRQKQESSAEPRAHHPRLYLDGTPRSRGCFSLGWLNVDTKNRSLGGYDENSTRDGSDRRIGIGAAGERCAGGRHQGFGFDGREDDLGGADAAIRESDRP